jgi:hypothetical protein
MDFAAFAKKIDESTAKAFVDATFNVVHAFLLKAEEGGTAVPPEFTDYNTASGLTNNSPVSGWISDDEVRSVLRKQVEAMKVANWVDGFLMAIKLMAMVGAI